MNPVLHPHDWQAKILLHESKRKVVLTGRQSGKTTLLKTIIYYTALGSARKEILVLAPTHGSVKELLWRAFTKRDDPLFTDTMIVHQDNQAMVIELFNGSRVIFKGTENISGLLGREVDLLVVDEWQSHSGDIWVYLEPLLATRGGTAIFTGTARKGNHIMTFYERGQTNPSWKSWIITTPESGSPAGLPENIELAKSSMSEEEFNQEYLCVPMSGEGLGYPKFSHKNIIPDTLFNKYMQLDEVFHIGVDFNISNMNAVVCVRENKSLYVIDEIQLKFANANTYSLVNEIKKRYGNKRIILYPDATGRNRSSNTVDPQNTNHHILKCAGYPLKFDYGGNPPIEDRTILVNSKILSMSGEITLLVTERCKHLINSLSTRTYRENKPIKDNITDHGCDCLDYVTWHLFNNRNNMWVGRI
jgi:hypothetical protein